MNRLSPDHPENVTLPPGPARGPKNLQELPEKDKKAIAIISSLFTAPIKAYGKVQDEQGSPIAAATVNYTLNDKYFGDGTIGSTVSDANGSFMISGNGASVYVNAQKEGYYRLNGKSNGTIKANHVTSVESPAAFILKKAGARESLLQNMVLNSELPVNGTPKDIQLSSRQLVAAGKGHVQVEVWVKDAKPLQYRGYGWKCRISVPNGGMTERKGEFDFEAPDMGYVPFIEVTMPAVPSDGSSWTDRLERSLFLKLPDGTYARASIGVSTDWNVALISCKSWWNPRGSRNLEAAVNDFSGGN